MRLSSTLRDQLLFFFSYFYEALLAYPNIVDIYGVNTEKGDNHEENAIHSRAQRWSDYVGQHSEEDK